MEDDIPELGSRYEDPEVEKGAPYRRGSFWQKGKDLLTAELYTEFVPRWFKKQDTKLPDRKTMANVAWLSTGFKIGMAGGSYALLLTHDFGEYESMIAGVGAYLAVDSFYGILDFSRSLPKRFRKAATLAVDLFAYPLYLMFRSRNARSSRRR